MKKIILTAVFLTAMTQLAFACPLHDGEDAKVSGSSAAADSRQSSE